MSSESWIERYIAGEHQAVWTEIQGLTIADLTASAHTDIRAVVQETLRRVRKNIELITQRLQKSKYEFVAPSSKLCLIHRPLVPPNEASPHFAAWLNDLAGPLPLTIIEWIVTVGDVNLVGNHPDWPERNMITNALVVEFELRGYADRGPGWDAKEHFEGELKEWKQNIAEYGAADVGPFLLPFAPDAYHKANVSGGAPYAIYLPDGSVDATCHIDGRDISFIDYLRDCFSSGGFPGAPSLPHIPSLRRDLLPL